MTSPTETISTGFVLGDKTYKTLKWLVAIVLPAFATLYLTLGQLWGFPEPEKVAASITAVILFLGIIGGISSSTYKKSDARFDGVIDVNVTDEGKKVHSLILNEGYDKIDQKKEILFKVSPPSENLVEPRLDIDLSPPDDPVWPTS